MGLGVSTHNEKHPDRHTAQGFLAFRPTTGVTMQYDVRADIKQAVKALEGLRKDQIPFATAYALTKTAQEAKKNIEADIRRVFDRPTPYTQKGVWIKAATKARLFAKVYLKDESFKGVPADRYLIHQIRGTSRQLKGFERLLQRSGVMPDGWFAVPTNAAPLDQYGNVPGGIITRILSQLQASRDSLANETPASKTRTMRRKGRRPSRYFVAYPGRAKTRHLTPGIYERIGFGFGDSIRPIFIYTAQAPKYRRVLRFDETVQAAVRDDLPRMFEQGFRIAQATQGTKGDVVATEQAITGVLFGGSRV